MSIVDTSLTIGHLLREPGLPRHEAEILLCGALECERAYLIAHAEDTVDFPRLRVAQAWFARRRAGEPVAYITGRREFYGLSLRVTPDVLIPRAETELLVELALDRVTRGTRVLELGTGSGAVAVALASLRPESQVTATDISAAALEIARRNADEHGAGINFVRSDWLEAIDASFDLIVGNPPYVAAGDPHLSRGDLRFEPSLALSGGADGLACLRTIAVQARCHLRLGAWLLLEHGYDQEGGCTALLHELGYDQVADHRDLAGQPRVVACVWRG